MMGFLARMRGRAARDKTVDRNAVDGLGTSALAVRAFTPIADSVVVEASDGVSWVVHALPLRCHVVPFEAAPEIGLRVEYCFDATGSRDRFALLLAAEGGQVLLAESVAAAMQDAVQGALQLGALELPPCTSDEEWHAFRGGFNELIYTRFGLVVEDCVPVDLHPATDFAIRLAAISAPAPTSQPAAPMPPPAHASHPASTPRQARVPHPAPVQQLAHAPSPAHVPGPAHASQPAPTPQQARAPHPAQVQPPAHVSSPAHVPGPTQVPQPAGVLQPTSERQQPAHATQAVREPQGAEAPEGADAAEGIGEPWLAWVRLTDMPVHGRRAAMGAPKRGLAAADAAALRRLFLELPALAAGLRALPMQEGEGMFAPLQDILRRLALAAVSINTMPSLTHAAPGHRLPKETQQLRTAHALSAQSALDEGWALLASMRATGLEPAKLADADRMLSNLEYSLAQRRATQP